MKLWIAFIHLCFFFTFTEHFIDPRCVKPTNESGPVFSPKMKYAKHATEGDAKTFYCCAYEVDRIEWFYKGVNKSIREINCIDVDTLNYCIFTEDRKHLTLFQISYSLNNGDFICKGYLNNSVVLQGKSKIVVAPNDYKLIEYESSGGLSKIPYKIGSSVTMYCVINIGLTDIPIMEWRKYRNGQMNRIVLNQLTPFTNRSNLTSQFSGFAEVNKFNVGYKARFNLTLHLDRLHRQHAGLYQCYTIVNTDIAVLNMTLVMEKRKIEWIIILAGLIGGLIVAGIFIWIARYDLLFLYKIICSALIKGESTNAYDFTFLYNFTHENEYVVIHKIIRMMENKGASTFFYHRDQTFGKDTLEDLMDAITNSQVVVIWITSSDAWSNPTIQFCLQVLFNKYPNIKRRYVLCYDQNQKGTIIPSKQVSADMKSCIWSKVFYWKYSSKLFLASYINLIEQWTFHKFETWLLSSRPIKKSGSPKVNKYSFEV